MVSSRRAFLTQTIGVAGAAIAGLYAMNSLAAANDSSVKPPLLGDPLAPKRLAMWGSYTCPFTAILFPILQNIVGNKPKTVSLEWHHFPIHAPDPALHVAGLAFKDAHFWSFAARVLSEVFTAGGEYKALTPEKIAAFAQAEGGSEETLVAAYADKAKWDAVKADLIAGQLLGVRVTPGLFYNGYLLTPNGMPNDRDAFEKSLRKMLQLG